MVDDILIVGLGETGASIGLALSQAGFGRTRTGFDADSRHARTLRKAGIVERLALNLERSAPQADLVVLSVPPGEAMTYLEVIAPRLKADSVLLDLAGHKALAAPWAASNMLQGRHYIGGYLTINPAMLLDSDPRHDPRHDLFREGSLALAIPPHTPAAAVDLVLAVASHLGATPFFLDPGEIDGVKATVDDLPALVGAALMRVALETPSWREARRLAGHAFATVAQQGALRTGDALQAALRDNQLAVLDRMDRLIEELHTLRRLLANKDSEAELSARLGQAAEAHGAWQEVRVRAQWAEEERGAPELPERSSVVERLLGFGQPLRPKDRR
jgi:prephenate dehydrogenase